MKDTPKELTSNSDIKKFIEIMKINKMYELPGDTNFKWAMIEHNEFGFCWTMSHKGICTTLTSTNTGRDIRYWKSEEEAKSDLIKSIFDEQGQ